MVLSNEKNLRAIKDATVAIGVIDRKADRRPVAVTGTGFFVNSKGYVVTAKHVLDGCDEVISRSDKRRYELAIAVLSVVTQGTEAQVRVLRDVSTYALRLINIPGYVGPIDPDIGIVIPGEGIEDIGGTPFLSIKQPPARIGLYKKMVMCGYPSGDESLDMFRRYRGLRVSPIIQFGHITGLMPTDDVMIPWGVQTDIMGTGGSSGSAIVDPTDGKVVGVAQNVLTGGIQGYTDPIVSSNGQVLSKRVPVSGSTNVGPVYGVSLYQIHNIPDRIEKEIVTSSNPSPNQTPQKKEALKKPKAFLAYY